MSTAYGPSGPGILLLCQSRRLLALADRAGWPLLALSWPQGWSPALHRHLAQGPESHGQSPLLPGLLTFFSFLFHPFFPPLVSLPPHPPPHAAAYDTVLAGYSLVAPTLKWGFCFERGWSFLNFIFFLLTEPPVFISGEFVLSWFLLI